MRAISKSELEVVSGGCFGSYTDADGNLIVGEGDLRFETDGDWSISYIGGGGFYTVFEFNEVTGESFTTMPAFGTSVHGELAEDFSSYKVTDPDGNELIVRPRQ